VGAPSLRFLQGWERCCRHNAVPQLKRDDGPRNRATGTGFPGFDLGAQTQLLGVDHQHLQTGRHLAAQEITDPRLGLVQNGL
jgi:hypothetical protein